MQREVSISMKPETHVDPLEGASVAESILEHIADAVVFADDSGTIRRWNHAAYQLFGHTPEEALGQRLDLIIPERLRPAHWRGFAAAMTSGALKLSGRPTLTRAMHRTGRKLYVEMTFALVTVHAAGGAGGAVAVARDVTVVVEKKRAAGHRDPAG